MPPGKRTTAEQTPSAVAGGWLAVAVPLLLVAGLFCLVIGIILSTVALVVASVVLSAAAIVLIALAASRLRQDRRDRASVVAPNESDDDETADEPVPVDDDEPVDQPAPADEPDADPDPEPEPEPEPAEQSQSADEPALETVEAQPGDVWVIDGRPRYHRGSCEFLRGKDAEPIPLAQALEDGFSPCSLCDPPQSTGD